MPDQKLLDQLAALNATLQSIPIRSAADQPAIDTLEAVKRGLDDARLGGEQRLGAFGRNEQIVAIKIEDAAEAADIVRALDLEPPKTKIGERRVEFGFRVAQ